jgi:hypothetical protein
MDWNVKVCRMPNNVYTEYNKKNKNNNTKFMHDRIDHIRRDDDIG